MTAATTSPTPKDAKRQLLPALCQRLPMITHLCMILFALYGPTHLPCLFVMVLFGVHLMLWSINFRTVFGAYKAWRGVRAHSLTDFSALYTESLSTHADPSSVLSLESVEHMIFIPNYLEDISNLRETLYLLSTHPLALKSYHPVLAMEGREVGSVGKAKELVGEFRSSFREIGYTAHPAGMEGEAAGKSSNLAWAVRTAWEELSRCADGEERVKRTVVTVLDADTALAGDYFTAVSCKYALRSADERERMYFCPPIVFDRNAHDVPVSVRITDIGWVLGGLSAIFPGSGAKIPTSAYSLSLSLAANVGFHDPGPQAIGEDMHMFVKCLFSTKGNLISETIYSPASQLDVVSSERGGLKGFWNDHAARYKQAIRHMWGSLDTGYAVSRVVTGDFDVSPAAPSRMMTAMTSAVFSSQAEALIGLSAIREESLPFSDRVNRWSLPQTDGCRHTRQLSSTTPTPSSLSTSPSSSSFLSSTSDDSVSVTSVSSEEEDDVDEKAALVHTYRPTKPLKLQIGPFFALFGRLYEAHLLMGHMVVLLAMGLLSTRSSLPSIALGIIPSKVVWSDQTLLVTWAYGLAEKMRHVSLGCTIIMFILYDRYHQQCVLHRWKTPNAAARMGTQSSDRSYRPFPLAMIDFLFMPAGVAFGIVPLLHAQLMHLFTDRLAYIVSFKPVSKEQRRDIEKGLA